MVSFVGMMRACKAQGCFAALMCSVDFCGCWLVGLEYHATSAFFTLLLRPAYIVYSDACCQFVTLLMGFDCPGLSGTGTVSFAVGVKSLLLLHNNTQWNGGPCGLVVLNTPL